MKTFHSFYGSLAPREEIESTTAYKFLLQELELREFVQSEVRITDSEAWLGSLATYSVCISTPHCSISVYPEDFTAVANKLDVLMDDPDTFYRVVKPLEELRFAAHAAVARANHFAEHHLQTLGM